MSDSGPKNAMKSAAEEVKGKAKEAVGAVTNNEEKREEGRAQQDKAAAQRDVAANEAKAEKARAEARAEDARERSHQR